MLVQLARRWDGDATMPISLAEVAADEDLPRAYLEQLVIPLRDAGIVLSTRGARGGYALARPPIEITMAEALRALEGPLAPMICASEDPDHADRLPAPGRLLRQQPLGPGPRRHRRRARRGHPRRPRPPPRPRSSTLDGRAPPTPSPSDRHAGRPAAARPTHRSRTTRERPAPRDPRTSTSPPSPTPSATSCRGSTSSSARARSTRSWAPTAPARRRSPTRSWATRPT